MGASSGSRWRPGTYTVRARERGGLRIGPLRVSIPPGHRVRDDLFIDVP